MMTKIYMAAARKKESQAVIHVVCICSTNFINTGQYKLQNVCVKRNKMWKIKNKSAEK